MDCVTVLRLVFISMPISPYPSLQSKRADLKKAETAEADSDQTAEASPRNPEAAILDPERLPSWQRPFVLGPNVRFTRTPHKKHPEPEMPAAAQKQQAAFGPQLPSPATVLQERIAEELPAERTVSSAEEATTAADEQKLPAGEMEEDTAPSIPWYLSREIDAILPAPEETGRAIAAENETPDMPDETAHAEDNCFSYLPDALAFEMMALAGLEHRPADNRTRAPVESPIQAEEPTAPLEQEAPRTKANIETAPAEAFTETAQDDMMITSWTATSDAVETVCEEPEDRAEEAPSPVLLYRQVLAYSPTRTAESRIPETPSVPSTVDEDDEDDEDIEEIAAVEEPVEEAVAPFEKDDLDTAEAPLAAAPELKTRPEPLNVLARHEETDFVFPSIDLLQMPGSDEASEFSQEALEQSAASWKAFWKISASRARSSTCVRALSSRCMNSSRRPASSLRG